MLKALTFVMYDISGNSTRAKNCTPEAFTEAARQLYFVRGKQGKKMPQCGRCGFDPANYAININQYDPAQEWAEIKSDVAAKITEIQSTWAPIASLLLLRPFWLCFFILFFAAPILAWLTFDWRNLSRAGDLSLPGFAHIGPLASLDPALVYSGAASAAVIGVLAAILGWVTTAQHMCGRGAAEKLRMFFDLSHDQCWVFHLSEAVAQLGAVDRSAAKNDVIKQCLIASTMWRRLERFTGASALLWNRMRRKQKEDRRSWYWLMIASLELCLIIAIVAWVHIQSLKLAVDIRSFDEFFFWFSTFTAAAAVTLVVVFLFMRWRANAAADHVAAVLFAQPPAGTPPTPPAGLTEREKRIAALDPAPLILRRYRSALDDLEIIMH